MQKLYEEILKRIKILQQQLNDYYENEDKIILETADLLMLLDKFVKRYDFILTKLEEEYNRNFFELYLMDDSMEPVKNKKISSQDLIGEFYEILDMFVIANKLEDKEISKNYFKFIIILLNNLEQILNETYREIYMHYKELRQGNIEVKQRIKQITKKN